MSERPCLEINNLSATVNHVGERVLRSVSLSVYRGEVHGLVGESGAGKSMIGKAVAGLLPRAVKIIEGSITLEGISLDDLDEKGRRHFLGETCAVIPQDPLTSLNPCRRIEPQITDRLIKTLGWKKTKARSRALELLEEVHIREPKRVLRAYPHELSGGMRQRILIASAFATEPKLIIADEPTTALDVTVQKQILKLIKEMEERHGTAMLFVTHDMGVVAKICKNVSVLYAGKVVEQTDVMSLFSGKNNHPYADALIEATPRYDKPDHSLVPVDVSINQILASEILEADKIWKGVGND